MRSTWIRIVTLVLAFGLVAAACGSDRDDDDTAADDDGATTTVADDDGGDGEATDDGGDGEAADDAGDGEAADDGGDGEAADDGGDGEAADGPMFGDLPFPCGPGDTSAYTETDQGVTADTITIGTGDDRGAAASPGLSIEIGDAVNALVDMCNEAGGINGRQIELNYYDAALFEVQNVMLESCEADFMLVGQGYAVDSLGEQTRVECGMPSVPTYTVSPAFANGPDMIQPLPNPGDFFPVNNQAYVAENFPEAAAASGVMYANFAATTDTKNKVLSATENAGLPFEWLIELEYNVQGEDDWTPFVLQLKDAGVQHLYFTGSCLPNYIGFMETARLNDFDPIVTLDANFYLDVCAEANAEGVMDNSYIRMAFYPFEEADLFPAVQQYLDMIEASGGKPSTLGMQATSAFLLWATGAQMCGAELTRDCVLDSIATITEWTGGGLHVPTNPASNLPPECGLVVSLEGTEYVRVFPEEPGSIDCRDDFVGQVTGPVVDQAQLDENRVSQVFLGG